MTGRNTDCNLPTLNVHYEILLDTWNIRTLARTIFFNTMLPTIVTGGTTVTNVPFLVAKESRTCVLDRKFAVGSQGGRRITSK